MAVGGSLIVPGSVTAVVVNTHVADKIGYDLAWLSGDYQLTQSVASTGSISSTTSGGATSSFRLAPDQPNASLLDIRNGSVVVDTTAVGMDPTALRMELAGIGSQITGTYGRMVSARVPLASLGTLATLPDLQFARAAPLPKLNAGKVDDQAVQAMASDVGSAQYGVDGTGVTVGVLSDSYNFLNGAAADVASGDLPNNVKVLVDSGNSDEGRAMLQLVHDVAPGAGLAFSTANGGQAAFAQHIMDLAAPIASGGAAANVIVDDVFYFAEPYFQDGVIAQAVNTVSNAGVAYFSSAGNQARNSYESTFTTSATAFPASLDAGTRSGSTNKYLDFSGTGNYFQPVTIQASGTMDLQWDEPYASASTGAPGTLGSASDIDLYFVNSTKTSIFDLGNFNEVGGDPIFNQDVSINGGGTFTGFLVIKDVSGAVPGLVRYNYYDGLAPTGFLTNTGASFGHNQATGGAGVGASAYTLTPAYGASPAVKESFSSAGGSPILFDTAGNRLGSQEIRQQPRFVSVDGSNTTAFFGADASNGLRTFFGTSAAAPHAAAVAALLKQEVPSLAPSQIYTIMQNTASDMGAAGYDFDTGFGFVRADRALQAAAAISISGQAYRDLNANGAHNGGEPGLGSLTVFLDANGNGVLDSATTGLLSSSDVPKAIPDATTNVRNPSRVTSSLVVSGLTGRVTKVTVTLSVTHTFFSDLGLTLISPAGIRVALFSNVGLANGGTESFTLDDAAAARIQSAPFPYSGSYHPQVNLAALVGENPNGTWKLEGRDYFAADAGTINSWGMNIAYADPNATTDSSGNYSFTSLPASAYYGGFHPALMIAGVSLSQPTVPYNLNLGVGSASGGADFGVLPVIVMNTVIDDGTSQRSMVRKILVYLSGTVTAGNITAGAFAVTQTSGTPTVFSTSVFAITALPNNVTAVELHFSGSGVVGGSLADGRYAVTIDGSKITDSLGSHVDAAGVGTAGSSVSKNFLRFFGDSNGDGIVDATDYLNFRNAYITGVVTVANSIFDHDGDGVFTTADLNAFNQRFAKRRLP